MSRLPRAGRFRSLTRTATFLGLLSSLLLVACAEGSSTVTRMASGVRYEGRFIMPEAYAGYLLGVERETRGDYPGALSAYTEAHDEDPDSPEIMARIGAAHCGATPPSRALANRAFARGLALDREYFGNYLERARCAERARDFSAALPDATEAVSRQPDDEAANLLVARLLHALGRIAEARAWLEAFASYHPASPSALHALELARASTLVSPPRPPPSDARSAAFAELGGGDTEHARASARTELEADPTNSDAWIATLVACDALHDDACFEAALGSLKVPSLRPSRTALGYLHELLARRAGASVSF